MQVLAVALAVQLTVQNFLIVGIRFFKHEKLVMVELYVIVLVNFLLVVMVLKLLHLERNVILEQQKIMVLLLLICKNVMQDVNWFQYVVMGLLKMIIVLATVSVDPIHFDFSMENSVKIHSNVMRVSIMKNLL
jgi:hypothetical protein